MLSEQLYPKPERERGITDTKRRWRVDYELAYDGGGSRWSGYYRTRRGAKIAAFFEVRIKSWGGSARLHDNWDGP